MAPKKDAAPKAGPKEPEKPVTPPEPTEGIGKFYYPTGATYEGGWKLVPETPNVGADVVAGKGNIAAGSKAPAAKPTTAKGAAEPPAAVIAATPPEKKRPNRQRNGKGLYIEGDYQYEGDWLDDKIHGTVAQWCNVFWRVERKQEAWKWNLRRQRRQHLGWSVLQWHWPWPCL